MAVPHFWAGGGPPAIPCQALCVCGCAGPTSALVIHGHLQKGSERCIQAQHRSTHHHPPLWPPCSEPTLSAKAKPKLPTRHCVPSPLLEHTEGHHAVAPEGYKPAALAFSPGVWIARDPPRPLPCTSQTETLQGGGSWKRAVPLGGYRRWGWGVAGSRGVATALPGPTEPLAMEPGESSPQSPAALQRRRWGTAGSPGQQAVGA